MFKGNWKFTTRELLFAGWIHGTLSAPFKNFLHGYLFYFLFYDHIRFHSKTQSPFIIFVYIVLMIWSNPRVILFHYVLFNVWWLILALKTKSYRNCFYNIYFYTFIVAWNITFNGIFVVSSPKCSWRLKNRFHVKIGRLALLKAAATE